VPLGKLNWKPASAPDSLEDWADKQRLDRDILLLFHQLADYPEIDGDLYFGTVFNLPYWEYLAPAGLDTDDCAFLQEGCLVMLLTMAWGCFDGADAETRPHLEAIRIALEPLQDDDEGRLRLIRCVKGVVAAACAGTYPDAALIAESNWVHREFVRGYFERMVARFADPYYNEKSED